MYLYLRYISKVSSPTLLNANFHIGQFAFQKFSRNNRRVETGANHGRRQGVSHVLGNPGSDVLTGLRIAGRVRRKDDWRNVVVIHKQNTYFVIGLLSSKNTKVV